MAEDSDVKVEIRAENRMTQRLRRNRGRRILWFRFYGFPHDARWHLTQIGKHLRSLLGLRP